MHLRSNASTQGSSPQPVTSFQTAESVPTLHGVATTYSSFRNRVVGDVRLADTRTALDSLLGNQIRLRADEGTPLTLGNLRSIANHVTIHALEHTSASLGNNAESGEYAVIHGGTDNANPTPSRTSIGDGVRILANAVVFRCHLGNNVTIGSGALVDGCQLPDNTVVPANTILFQNVNQGSITW